MAAGARAADPVGRKPAAHSDPAGSHRPERRQDRAGQGVGECHGGEGQDSGRGAADRAPNRRPRSRVERIVRGIRRVRAAPGVHVRRVRAHDSRHPDDRHAEEPAIGRDPGCADSDPVRVDRDRRQPGRRRRPPRCHGPTVQDHRRDADRQRHGPPVVLGHRCDGQSHRTAQDQPVRRVGIVAAAERQSAVRAAARVLRQAGRIRLRGPGLLDASVRLPAVVRERRLTENGGQRLAGCSQSITNAIAIDGNAATEKQTRESRAPPPTRQYDRYRTAPGRLASVGSHLTRTRGR